MLLFLLIITLPEDMIFKTDQEIDFELILEDLELLKAHPLDINSATVEDLSQIPFLALNTIIKIIEYRERHGPLKALDELLKIPGFDKLLLDIIRSYVTVGFKKVEVKKFAARARLQTELPMEEQSSEYYSRTDLLIGQYGVHMVTEKDPYERALLDHYAIGLLVDEGKRKFALGSYNLDLGAGVVLSSVGSFFRGIDFRIMMNERGLVPYTSVIENGGFFGAAFSDSFFVDFTLFYSNQKLDGRIDSSGFARSVDESGEHVDSLSMTRKNRINEEIFGYDLRYRKLDMLVSSRAYFCHYDPAFAAVDSVAKFYGDDFFIGSVEFKYIGESFVIFSEVARSWKNQIGGLFGFSAVFPYIDFTLAGKYFPGGFYSPKGIEATPNYAGGTIDLKHHSRVIDVGVNLTLDNRIDEDTTNYDIKLSLAKRLGILDARVNFRHRYRAEEKDISGSGVLLRIRPVGFMFFDFRFEQKTVYEEMVEDGIFGALEIGFDFPNLDFRARYGVFDTDSYAARIYAYEIDLPGIINNRMLYNNGKYGFVYITYKPLRMMRVSAKYLALSRGDIADNQIGGQFDFIF